jgi:predicted nucleic acid-binding protein
MIYLDSSFVLSYLFKESEYQFSKEILESETSLWSSDLMRFECIVSFWKKSPKVDAERFKILESLWNKISFVKLQDSILEILIKNPKISQLRALDSIHIASIIFIDKAIGNQVIQLAAFDDRMLDVAKSLKIPVLTKQTPTKKKR